MEVRLLKAFIAVAEELNFRKAADKLGMSQPPLTRIISQLESDLNVQLFTRSTRSVELTGAGLHLLKKGRDILTQISQLELEVRTLQKTKTGKLHLSFTGMAMHSELPRLISSFKEQFPKIAVVLMDAPISTVKQNLLSAKTDLHFGANIFKASEIKQVPIQSQELGLLVPRDNELSEKKLIKLRDLEGETLIFHGKHEHLGFQEEFLEYLNLKNITPRVYYKKFQESCGKLVVLGKGLLLTTKKNAFSDYDASFIPLAEYTPKMKTFASWSTENSSLPLMAFVNFLEERELTPKSNMDGHLG